MPQEAKTKFWAERDLCEAQILYAAMDAWASEAVFCWIFVQLWQTTFGDAVIMNKAIGHYRYGKKTENQKASSFKHRQNNPPKNPRV